MTVLAQLRIGAHVSSAGRLADTALAEAAAVGAEAIQLFVANPRAWAAPAPAPDQDAKLLAHTARTGTPVFVHAPYLVNVASPDRDVARRSADALRHSVQRAARVGARGVVVHCGTATDGDRAAGLVRTRAALLPLLDGLGDGDPDLLIEPMAGQGHALCSTVPELIPYLGALDWHPRAGLCLDTCHLFAAGHDLDAPDGFTRLLAELGSRVPGRLRLWHANDSADPRGSRRDRHQSIGAGHIGSAPFAELLAHPDAADVPLIVETPGGADGHAADVARLRTLRRATPDDLAIPRAPTRPLRAGSQVR